MEYLVTMTTNVPGGTSPQTVDDVRAREAAHTDELARQGKVLRLWRPPLQPVGIGEPGPDRIHRVAEVAGERQHPSAVTVFECGVQRIGHERSSSMSRDR